MPDNLVTKMIKTTLTQPLYWTQEGDLCNITRAYSNAELAFLTATWGDEELNSMST